MPVACNPVMKQLPSSPTIAFAIYLCVLVCYCIGNFSHLVFHGVGRKSKENYYRDSALPGSIQLKYRLGLWGLRWTRNSLMPKFAARVWNKFYLQHYSFLLTRCLQIDWSLKGMSTSFSHVLGLALRGLKWWCMNDQSFRSRNIKHFLFYYKRSEKKVRGLHLKIVFCLSGVKKQACCV